MDKYEIENEMAELIETASGTWPGTIELSMSDWIAEVLVENGYRLDPYPNGKSKDELIARIETVEAERNKTRNLLMVEHEKTMRYEWRLYAGNPDAPQAPIAGWHERLNPSCPVCTFLAETITVKP